MDRKVQTLVRKVRTRGQQHGHYAPFASVSGYLVSIDSYMNLQLANADEYIDGQCTGSLGEILIRCNNVLYLRGASADEEIEEADRD